MLREMPRWPASVRVDQWVAFSGTVCKVAFMMTRDQPRKTVLGEAIAPTAHGNASCTNLQ